MRAKLFFGFFIVTASILCCEDVYGQILWQVEDYFYNSRDKRSPEIGQKYAESNATQLNGTSLNHKRLLDTFKTRWPVEEWREFRYFTDDYLDLINEHWLQFSPPSEVMQKSLGAIYVLFSTVGCWGNVIVLFMYLR
ncbi:unnamed protein product [Leptosia nina]|uniref:Uncharacterized protein n=1 Tax=Leptosia nina TaxID=320188 RepID=A0AAV1J8N4_9NEOP